MLQGHTSDGGFVIMFKEGKAQSSMLVNAK